MSWDDGSHAKVKKVQLTYDEIIYSIQVTYDGTALQSQRRGSVGPKSAEFILEAGEYITALSAYGKTLSTQDVITALTFTTNKKTYGPYGNKSSFQISAPEATGKQIAGFLGTSGTVLNSIDVHYAPVPTGPGTGSGTSGTGSGTGGTGSGTGGTGSGTGGTGSGTGSGTGLGPQKLDAQGGTGGTAWDDGSDHDGVTKIYVGQGIQFVKFDYVKNGQTKQGALHGEESRGSTKEIVINHPDEYIVSVEGWSDSFNVILGIQFKTNQKTSEFIGYDFDGSGTKFTLHVQDKKIIGFHGFASKNLNSIGAYLVPLGTIPLTPATPSQKLEGFGGDGGTLWDDGAFDGVRKVYIGQAQDGIGVVKFVYDKGAQVVVGNEHGKTTMLGFEEFELDYPSEYITAVEGTYDKIFGSDSTVINMLRFKTNKQTSDPFGMEAGTDFVLKKEGYKIVGFHGRVSDLLYKFGVHVLPISN